ncbi:MAG: alanine--tRNA ligase, partial [Clostridiales bacterium]|nr:alanine--tRNA ligase [Clostridiales bacterium]
PDCGQLTAELKEKDKTIEALNAKLAAIRMDSLLAGAKDVNGVKLVTAVIPGAQPDALRAMCDKARDFSPNMVAVLAGTHDGKANIAACVAKEALAKGANAGQIVRQVAQLAGGNGGGRPDSAMAGAKDLAKLDEALAQAEKIVANMIH